MVYLRARVPVVQCIEVLKQARPKALARTVLHRDADYRHAMRWYTRIGSALVPASRARSFLFGRGSHSRRFAARRHRATLTRQRMPRTFFGDPIIHDYF